MKNYVEFTDEGRQKMANILPYLPKAHGLLVEFARFLGPRLTPRLTAEDFASAADAVLYDLRMGVDGSTHEPIISSLVGYIPTVYNSLALNVGNIADVVFSPEFGAQVRKVQDETRMIAHS